MFVFIPCCVLWVLVIDSSFAEEELCLSRYDYDYKMMQKMFDLEQKLKQLEALPNSEGGGYSVYTRWGKNKCEGGSTVVYTGQIAGRKFNETGGSSDNICLPSDPTWLKYKDGVHGSRGFVYGTEINTENSVFTTPVDNQNMPCTVCKTPKRTVLMIPGRATCYDGWTLEYKGYLMAGYFNHTSAHNHICMDALPDNIVGGGKNDDEHILYLTEARCGSLACPPYVEGRELACAVCSM